MKYVLSDYVSAAMAQAVYDKLEDGTFAAQIPPCEGVIAFGLTLRECEEALRSTLEDWILLALRLGHSLPVIGTFAADAGLWGLNGRFALRG